MNEEEKKGQFETDAAQIESEQKIETLDADQEERERLVKYGTHKKLLNQHKNLKSELDELREWKSKVEEDELAKKGDYEKLLRTRDEQVDQLSLKLTKYEQEKTESRKLGAFVSKLPGKIKRQEFLSFADIESIDINPDTGEIDEFSLEKAVNSFVDEYGQDCIKPSNPKGLPSVGHFGGKPNLKRSLKDLSREELRKMYIEGKFNK